MYIDLSVYGKGFTLTDLVHTRMDIGKHHNLAICKYFESKEKQKTKF